MTAPSPDSPTALDDLVALLDLEAIEVNLFRGVSPDENRHVVNVVQEGLARFPR